MASFDGAFCVGREMSEDAMQWRCNVCRTLLGEIRGGRVTIRHSGREIETDLPVMQRCHRCGALNCWDVDDDGTEKLEVDEKAAPGGGDAGPRRDAA